MNDLERPQRCMEFCRILLFFGVVWLAALIAFGNGQMQTTLLLTKEEAMTRALESNLGIKIERARVEIAEQGIELEKGVFDPKLSASITTESGINQTKDSVAVDLEGLVSTGGRFSLGVGSNESAIIDDQFNSFAGLTFRQPLLRNFGFTTNLAALRIARYQFDLSEWEFKQALLDTIASTIFAFNDLYEAQKNLESSIRIRDLTHQTVLDNDKRAALGIIARLDVLEAQAQLASRNERVLAATNSVTRAQNRIKPLIFDNAQEALSYNLEAQAYGEPQIPDDFSTLLATFLENTPNYRIGVIAIEIAQLRFVRDRNLTLPTLDLIAQAGFRGTGGSLGESIESVFSRDNDFYSIGASIEFPVFNRSARAREVISAQGERIAEADLERIKQAIQLEFHTSFQILQTNYKRVDATRSARELAEQSLEAEQRKFEAGTSSTFFVLRLQSDLALAELREISAVADYNRSVADFNRLRGVLE